MSASAVTEGVRHPTKLFVGGEWTEASDPSLFDVRNSATEEVFISVAAAQEADVNRAVAAARRAFDHGPWPRMKPVQRAPYLRAIANAWRAHSQLFADAWTLESGVVNMVAGYTNGGIAETFDYYAGLADSFVWEERHVADGKLPALLVREPVGVVAAIIPWNAPGVLLSYKAASALIAGCPVIIKASPEAPLAAYLFAQICEEVGLPAGVVNVLTADRDVSERLVRHPGVDKVSFTGSTAAGQKIAAICGERLARCTLELGGKSPAIILDDYDVATAAQTIARIAPVMTGQVCASLTRIIVTSDRQDALAEALEAAFSAIRVDDPFDPATQMGPLATQVHRERVERYIAKGKAEGARLVAGGGRPGHLDRGYFVEPTIFSDVDNNHVIAREEIFGPVLSIIPARDEEHAVEIANDTIYGLNASVFTNDPDRAYAVGRRIQAGTIGHNDFRTDFSVGFGGFKQSGIGREGGVEGLLPYLETKTMVFETMPSTTGAKSA